MRLDLIGFVYTAVGCGTADVPSIPGAKVDVSADGKSAVVECENSVRWTLDCVSNKWLGNVGNCTGAAVANGKPMHTPCIYPLVSPAGNRQPHLRDRLPAVRYMIRSLADLEEAEPAPPPPLGDELTPSLTALLICDSGTVWRHHRQFISSNT